MSELKSKLNRILDIKNTKIIPENIKKDIEIFDIIGTLEEGGGSGDVKLFDTIEHMQADLNPKENDLAIVYREELQAVQEDSEFDNCTFPSTVVLDEAFTDEIYGRFRVVDSSSGWFDGRVEMSSSSFRFNGYGESDEIRVEYESQDGITYTRSDEGEELQEFSIAIRWESWGDPFNNVIGNFMRIGGNYFEGMYKYKINNIHKDIIVPISTFNYIDNNIVPVNTNLQINVNDYNIFNTAILACKEYVSATTSSNSGFIFCNDDISHIYVYTINNFNMTFNDLLFDENNIMYFVSNASRDYYVNGFDYDVNTEIVTPISLTEIPYTSGKYNMIAYSGILGNIIGPIYNNNFNGINIKYRQDITDSNIKSIDNFMNYYTKNEYTSISSQLNATDEYVYEKTFYGKNGVENGTLTTNVSNSFTDVNAGVYAKIQKQYDNMTPRVLTDQDKTINTNIIIIPCKSDGTPLLDTSNVTNMNNMFISCTSLINIPLLNTSKVTTMESMFINCTSLINIPQLDTSSVTNMISMFNSCTSLINIPLLDTSSVNSMRGMFYYCKNLTTIPLLDTSNVTDMRYMFSICNSLSNESLNNILMMCVNSAITSSTYTSYKKLSYIGLTQEQATICQSLSNWSAFEDAGWTTGY